MLANEKNNPPNLDKNKINNMYYDLIGNGQGSDSVDKYKERIGLLMQYTVNSRHMAWAINELADLSE